MHVSTRMNSVCKELELAGAIESSVVVAAAVAAIGVRNCVMLVNTRTNSVCKGPGPVRAIEKRANKGASTRPQRIIGTQISDILDEA